MIADIWRCTQEETCDGQKWWLHLTEAAYLMPCDFQNCARIRFDLDRALVEPLIGLHKKTKFKEKSKSIARTLFTRKLIVSNKIILSRQVTLLENTDRISRSTLLSGRQKSN